MANPFPIPRSVRKTDILLGTGGSVYGPFDGFRIFDIDDVMAYTRLEGEIEFISTAVTVEKVDDLPFDFFTADFGAPALATTEYVISSERIAERSAGVINGTRIDAIALEKELSKIATALHGSGFQGFVRPANQMSLPTPPMASARLA
jgi:hypothetical protein